jgi:2-polyprenyl-3-methyl-5-hydroxy-6-metoxy-1,4-benzoquinol methylase
LSSEAIETARADASRQGLRNVEFVARDLSDFDVTAGPPAYEFITTFDAIHDQAKPLNVLKGIHSALMTDGVYLMQDIKGSSFVQLRSTNCHTIPCTTGTWSEKGVDSRKYLHDLDHEPDEEYEWETNQQDQ